MLMAFIGSSLLGKLSFLWAKAYLLNLLSLARRVYFGILDTKNSAFLAVVCFTVLEIKERAGLG